MKNKRLKQLISIILNIFLVITTIVLGVIIYNYVQTKILNKDYCNIFGYTAFKVVSGSMADTINIGDIVIAKVKNDKTEFNEQDIIVFKQDNNIITHRIVDIEGDKITTKGDANNTNDKTVSKNQIIGKVTKVITNLEIWKKVFTNPSVFISIIITVSLFAVAFSLEDNNLKDDIKWKLIEEKVS